MGVDYTAIAVVGVRLNPRKLLEERRTRGCRHKLTAPESKFCPTCGRPAWEIELVATPACQTEFPTDGLDEVQSVAGLELFRGTRNEATDMPSEVFIGYGVKNTDDGAGAGVDLPVNARFTIRSALEPLGLWNEEDFGLWAVLRCSY